MKPKITKACKGPLHNGEVLPITRFVKNKSYKDGRSNFCRKCNDLKYNKKPKEVILEELKTINDKLDILLCTTKSSE